MLSISMAHREQNKNERSTQTQATQQTQAWK